MSELPPEPPDWERREQSVAKAREAIGDGLTIDTISVAYDSPAYDSGQVWIKGTCSGCPAELVTRASHAVHLKILAFQVGYTECMKFGHDHQEVVKEAFRRLVGTLEYDEDEDG